MKKVLSISDILPKFQKKIKIQDYSKRPIIEGVNFIEINRFIDDGGDFLELARLNNGELAGFSGFKVAQISISTVMPGVIKGFHLHLKQTDVWFVNASDRLLVGLYDLRKQSKTAGVGMRFVMGEGKTRLLVIPPGVAHGCANLWQKETKLIYLINEQFDINKPDEQRFQWDLMGSDFWQMKRE